MNREVYNNLEKMLKMENKSDMTFERYVNKKEVSPISELLGDTKSKQGV